MIGRPPPLPAVRLSLAVPLAIATALSTGCSGYRPPVVTVLEASVVEVTDEALRFDVVLELTNPNSDPVELREFAYAVSIDGGHVYDGRRAAEATLSGGGAKRIALPVVVRFDRVGWSGPDAPRAAAWRVTGTLLYLTPGWLAEILLDTKLSKPEVGFTGDGRLDGDGLSAPPAAP